jgi:dynein heavy chain
VDDVRAIVQRAVKDLAIEMSLKTYEEVWLSKIFELRPHTRNKIPSAELAATENQSEYSEAGNSVAQGPVSKAPGGTRTTSRISNQSSLSRNKRSSISSLPASLLNLGEVSVKFVNSVHLRSTVYGFGLLATLLAVAPHDIAGV